LVNAVHAIESKIKSSGSKDRGLIVISTRQSGEMVEVRISDSGSGIPEEIIGRIFDPFFTTKTVGKGTGQGLAIAHDVITKKHGGTIRVESEAGQGATFIIVLPIELPSDIKGACCTLPDR